MRSKWVWWWFVALALSVRAVAQEGPSYTIRAESSLTLIDLTAVDHNTYLPDATLTRDELAIFDNGKPVPLSTFDHGQGSGARPIALWLVVQCSMKGWGFNGSGFIAGHGAWLAKGLTHLASEDTVAVAHWCDDGSSAVDRMPSADAVDAIAALDRATAERKLDPPHGRQGEIALQEMVRKINAVSMSTRPRPLPVLVLLHGDTTAAPGNEIDSLLKNVLETSALAYVMNNGQGAPPGAGPGERRYVLHQLADGTGGAAMEVRSAADQATGYSDALEAILERLHMRYQLGFVPRKLDRQWHLLEVRLTADGKRHHPGLLLGFRKGYDARPSVQR